MKSITLLPHRLKAVGWVILGLGLLSYSVILITKQELEILNVKFFTAFNSELLKDSIHFGFSEVNLTNTLCGVFVIVGGLLVAFSKEKNEDEYIAQLRLQSFQWAILINYIILLLAFLLVFGFDFISVMIYNIFTPIGFFILRFNYLLYRTAHDQ